MKIILRQNHEKLGNIGDILEVKTGYARNYLIPRKIAFEANASNLRALEEEKKQHSDKQTREFHHAKRIETQLDKVSVTLKVKVGEDEKLFGSVTSQMIAEALVEKGITVDKRIIELEEPIKALGIYTINVKLHTKVTGKVKVWVVRE
ncbi:MAG: 50S ribosomal protein L9 [Bacteroidota bacterium]|nr:50S ribosomal protein L9 [Bacteroidota bacterium]